jgi:hypothetical protein
MHPAVANYVIDEVIEMDQHGSFSGDRVVTGHRLDDSAVVDDEATCPAAADLFEQALHVHIAAYETHRDRQNAIATGVGKGLVEASVLLDGDAALADGGFLFCNRRPKCLDVPLGRPERRESGDFTLDGTPSRQDLEELADGTGTHALQKEALRVGVVVRLAELGQAAGACFGERPSTEPDTLGIAAKVELAEYAPDRGRALGEAFALQLEPQRAAPAGVLASVELGGSRLPPKATGRSALGRCSPLVNSLRELDLPRQANSPRVELKDLICV